jgi:uncharacterized protein YggE
MQIGFSTLIAPLLMLLAGSVAAGTIKVTGEGIIDQVPDQVLVQLRVVKLADSAQQAKAGADKVVTEVLRVGRELGLKAQQINAADLSLSARYDYRERKRVLLGMEAARQIVIVVTEPAQLAPLLDQVIAAGVDEVQGVRWHFSQLSALQHQARIAALKDARRQAESLAAVYGVELDQVVEIDTVSRGAAEPMLRMAMADEAAGYQAPSQRIAVQVAVEFALK